MDNIFTRDSEFKGASVVPIIRLFRNNIGLCFVNKAHEVIDETSIKNRIGRMNVPIHHLKYFKGEDDFKRTELRYLDLLKMQLIEDPRNVKIYFDIGLTYRNILKDFNNALEYFKKALDIEESSEILISIGKTYSDMGKTEESIKFYNKASAIDPKNPVVFVNIGIYYYRRQLYEEALVNLKKSLELGITNRQFVLEFIEKIKSEM